jgi:hypothetical protein
MATVILNYDIKAKPDGVHLALKQELIKNYKFSEYINAKDGKWYKLPNTTVRKLNTTQEDVLKEFKAACLQVKATIEKYLIIDYTSGTVNSDVILEKPPIE